LLQELLHWPLSEQVAHDLQVGVFKQALHSEVIELDDSL
jgi:hypothetical protein